MDDETNPIARCECGEAKLEPERSVPLAGFSRKLRLAPDSERYWFPFALRGGVALPVHIVFSPLERNAEIKAADLKAYRVSGVASACEAQRRWIAWWRRGKAASAFSVPRRAGRFPRIPSPASDRGRAQVPQWNERRDADTGKLRLQN